MEMLGPVIPESIPEPEFEWRLGDGASSVVWLTVRTAESG